MIEPDLAAFERAVTLAELARRSRQLARYCKRYDLTLSEARKHEKIARRYEAKLIELAKIALNENP